MNATRLSSRSNRRARSRSSRRTALLALGAGAAVMAISLASAAGLGGLTLDRIGAENAVAVDPFSDGVNVTWGEPFYDAVSGEYVVDSFSVAPNGLDGLPAGKLRVTLSDASGAALTEATATTTGISAPEVFTLGTPIPVSVISGVAIVLHDVDLAAASYGVLPSHIGTSPSAIWQASGPGTVELVPSGDGGTALELSGDGSGMMHSTGERVYNKIDNSRAALLDWGNFLSGSTNDDIDPATGQVLPATGIGTVLAKVDAGSTLWFDIDLAYGDAEDDLSVTRMTCKLNAGSSWTTIDLSDCFSIDDNIDTRWISTEAWTFNDPWFGAYSYEAGEPYNLIHGSPAIATVAGFGFHVEGGGSAQVQQIGLRGQTISFTS